MPRALQVCPVKDCTELTTGGPCPPHLAEREQRRGTAAQRGYGGARWAARRRACLRRDPICTCTDTGHDHGARCWAPSTDADHDPVERKDLVARGVKDPDALVYLRGKCGACHKRRTAAATPGGWHRRR